jgi:beta-lactamase regulating signal transducer with metallopeptidase domain
MFALRGIAVSVSLAVIVYGSLSVLAYWMWRRVGHAAQQYSPKFRADILFALRLAPLATAAAVTVIFAVPSFVLLEPRGAEEAVGVLPTILGICGIAFVLAGVWNAAVALLRSSRALKRWSIAASAVGSAPIGSNRSVSILRSASAAPPLAAAGIFRHTVWLSATIESVLSGRELQSALRHEIVHVQSKDNLRKLILRMIAFPGMAALETAWREASEMAADDAAVSNSTEALDLAGAVIKISRMALLEPAAELTTALVGSAAESVSARVERLMTWSERQNSVARFRSQPAWLFAASLVLAVTISYGRLLILVHAATEWLVR